MECAALGFLAGPAVARPGWSDNTPATQTFSACLVLGTMFFRGYFFTSTKGRLLPSTHSGRRCRAMLATYSSRISLVHRFGSRYIARWDPLIQVGRGQDTADISGASWASARVLHLRSVGPEQRLPRLCKTALR